MCYHLRNQVSIYIFDGEITRRDKDVVVVPGVTFLSCVAVDVFSGNESSFVLD